MSKQRWVLKYTIGCRDWAKGVTIYREDIERVDVPGPDEMTVKTADLRAVLIGRQPVDITSNQAAACIRLRALLPPEEPVVTLCPDGHVMGWRHEMGIGVWLECPTDDCKWRGPARANEAAALAAWNRRAAPVPSPSPAFNFARAYDLIDDGQQGMTGVPGTLNARASLRILEGMLRELEGEG